MIGRKKEVEELNKLYGSKQSEFLALYGRRRVGKTYLIDQVFKNRFAFRHTGLSPVEIPKKRAISLQLAAFNSSLNEYGLNNSNKPSSWLEAFNNLKTLLKNIPNNQKKVVFLDEVCWMDTKRSDFVAGLSYFWNSWASFQENILLIVCGSSNSWMLNNLVNSHGGLYNRLTYEIKLEQFTLKECEEFFIEKNIDISRYDICQTYMIFGGIPYYLGYYNSSFSFSRNIDLIIFNQNARLKNEYNRLFDSAFDSPVPTKKIVEFLSTKNTGYTRNEICKHLNIKDGGTLSKYLNALVNADFIVKYSPLGTSRKIETYKLVDYFCLFYLNFIVKKQENDENFYEHTLRYPETTVWKSLAFERVCFSHIRQIKKALKIEGVLTKTFSYNDNSRGGSQIDLIINRDDNIINLCEIKFYSDLFNVSEQFYLNMLHKKDSLKAFASKKKTIQTILITTFGLNENKYSNIFTNTITLNDFFE